MIDPKEGFFLDQIDESVKEIKETEIQLLKAQIERLKLKQVDTITCLEEALRHTPQDGNYQAEMIQKAMQILQSER